MNTFVKGFGDWASRPALSLLLLASTIATTGTPTASYASSNNISSAQFPTLGVSSPNRQTDTVTISSDRSNTLIDVFSEFGIGRATISSAQGKWSETVTVRLHLRGLEGLTATNGITTVEKQQLRVQAYNRAMNSADSEYLTDETGYYEVRLPKALFIEGATDIQIQWVDFYR